MKFNKFEWEIIKHRLEVPYAIAEVLEDELPEDFSDEALAKLCNDMLDNPDMIDLGNPTHKAIMEDCCEGCVFFALLDDAVATSEESRTMFLNYHKAAKSLEKKIGVAVTVD